jgi:hypothetical protein
LNLRKASFNVLGKTHAVYPRAGGEIRRPTEKSVMKKGDTMHTLFELRETVSRAITALVVFLVIYKFLLPLIIKKLKVDFLVILAILYLLLLASFKIWPVW